MKKIFLYSLAAMMLIGCNKQTETSAESAAAVEEERVEQVRTTVLKLAENQTFICVSKNCEPKLPSNIPPQASALTIKVQTANCSKNLPATNRCSMNEATSAMAATSAAVASNRKTKRYAAIIGLVCS